MQKSPKAKTSKSESGNMAGNNLQNWQIGKRRGPALACGLCAQDRPVVAQA
jgi:hypothetical protein